MKARELRILSGSARYVAPAQTPVVLGIIVLSLTILCCQAKPDQDRVALRHIPSDLNQQSEDAAGGGLPSAPASDKPSETPVTQDIAVASFKSDAGWGYIILVGGEPVIRQPHVPAVSGRHGFSSEEEAVRVGRFVADKLRNGVFPPQVTPAELESLGVAVISGIPP